MSEVGHGMTKHEALTLARNVMEQLRLVSVSECLSEGKQPFDAVLNRTFYDGADFNNAQALIGEIIASFGVVECAHCDDDEVAPAPELSDIEKAARQEIQRLRDAAKTADFAAAYGADVPHLSMESAYRSAAVKSREEYPSKDYVVIHGDIVEGDRLITQVTDGKPEGLIGKLFRIGKPATGRTTTIRTMTTTRTTPAGPPPFIQWVRLDPGEKNYHCDIGFPEGFDISRYIRHLPEVLLGTDHYIERQEEKRLPQRLSKDWVTKARVITITRSSDRALQRYAVRGPWSNGKDLTVVIDAASGFMVTGWYNRRDDWHRLTSTTYCQPEEV